MKFQYSPGQIGYGTQGADGSTGLTGNAIYFTDRNPDSDIIRMRDLIENNEILWASVVPGTKLPQGRTYSTGDIIIDYRGFVYEINLNFVEKYFDTGAVLNKPEFFTNSEVTSANGFDRWYNRVDPSLRYIIDNFLSTSNLDYSKFPSAIYGVPTKNFARIEHGDIVKNGNIAFSLYSSGIDEITDDDKSFGIVKVAGSNQFRIGNINNSNLRNTNLIFDVSSLMYKKEAGNLFNKNTPSGTILTNKEVSANLILDPNFNIDPPSFFVQTYGNYLVMNWNLADFTSDPDIKGTIIFTKEVSTGVGSWNLDASVLRPMSFFDVPTTGSFTISQLIAGDTYKYYMIIEKNGWERTSAIKTFICAGSPAYLTISDPASKTLSANYLGYFTPGATYKYGVDLDTNSFTGWNAVANNSWIKLIPTSPSSPVAGPGTFDVSLLRNTGTSPRSGTITVNSQAAAQIITVNQDYYTTVASFVSSGSNATNRGTLTFSPALTDQTFNVTMDLYIHACAERTSVHHERIQTYISIWKNGAMVYEIASGIAEGTNSESKVSNQTGPAGYTFSMNYSDTIQIRIYSQYRSGGGSWSTKTERIDWLYDKNAAGYMHRWGGGWARIKSIVKISGDGIPSVNPSLDVWYKRRDTTLTNYYYGVVATPPTIQHV